MTTLQINTNDITTIEEIKNIVTQKFHLEVHILNDKKIVNTKTKWADFAEKMDGLFTPDIVKHIKNSRKEARDNFIVNN